VLVDFPTLLAGLLHSHGSHVRVKNRHLCATGSFVVQDSLVPRRRFNAIFASIMPTRGSCRRNLQALVAESAPVVLFATRNITNRHDYRSNR